MATGPIIITVQISYSYMSIDNIWQYNINIWKISDNIIYESVLVSSAWPVLSYDILCTPVYNCASSFNSDTTCITISFSSNIYTSTYGWMIVEVYTTILHNIKLSPNVLGYLPHCIVINAVLWLCRHTKKYWW